MSMWIMNGIRPSTGQVRQHSDLSYWMSDREVVSALGLDAQSGDVPVAVTAALVNLLNSRRRVAGGVQANFDRALGVLNFVVEHKMDWEPIIGATWIDDGADPPDAVEISSDALGRGVVWHLEGFDRKRLFMVEHFELSHRISEAEIRAALGISVVMYQGGLPPTPALLNLVDARIGLPLSLNYLDYQVNVGARYGRRAQAK
jgi:hypothetical protein